MPFLTYLDPASVDPDDLVDRTKYVGWLRASLESFFRAPDKSRGRTVAILGERGIGKSIVMRKVIDDLRRLHSATTLFLVVDCRRTRDQRRVYREIARQAVSQLGTRGDPALLDTARLLETIASFDDVERRVLAEHVTSYKNAVKLKGGRELLGILGASYDVNISRSSQSRAALEGRILFDGTRLRDLVVAFVNDLREHAGLDVILVLDNLDELDHESILSGDARERLAGEIDGLLGLAEAPIGLVLTARTYFAGQLTRQVDANKVLARLENAEHVDVVRRRLAHEAPNTRVEFDEGAWDACIERLAELAPTPLALLSWFKYIAENELHSAQEGRPEVALRQLLRDRYAYIRPDKLDALAAVFAEDPTAPVPESAILEVCDGNQAIFAQLLRSQLVLPVDFWAPYEFTLAPELHFLCHRSVGEGGASASPDRR